VPPIGLKPTRRAAKPGECRVLVPERDGVVPRPLHDDVFEGITEPRADYRLREGRAFAEHVGVGKTRVQWSCIENLRLVDRFALFRRHNMGKATLTAPVSSNEGIEVSEQGIYQCLDVADIA
jgi:hypothetical protein